MKEVEPEKLIVDSAHNVDTSHLHRFYHQSYPDRPYRLESIWKWIYRSSFYSNEIPLVMKDDHKVIAHAGMIPFKAMVKEKLYNASWFVDFAILDEFQRKGLGQILTKRWMDFSHFYVTFCNEKSLGVFKKLGWIQSSDTFLHYYLINPFSHPKLVNKIPSLLRRFLNFTTSPFLRLNYCRYATQVKNLKLEMVTEEAIKKLQQKKVENNVEAVRDFDYFNWRVLQSPFKEKYRLCSIDKDLYFLIKFQDNRKNSQHIDLMWISDKSKTSEVRGLLATLALWGIKNGKSHIRYFTSSRARSNFLKQSLFPIIRSPIFAYFSRDTELLSQLKESDWNWELIDSDFEFNS